MTEETMSYGETLVHRLRCGIHAVDTLDREPIKKTHPALWVVYRWIKVGESHSGEVVPFPPPRTAPPVVIGWVGQVIFNEDFNATGDTEVFPENSQLVDQGNDIRDELADIALAYTDYPEENKPALELIKAPEGVSGACVLEGTLRVFQSDAYEEVDPGAIDFIRNEYQKKYEKTPKLGDHDPHLAVWAFQSLVLEDARAAWIRRGPDRAPQLEVRVRGNRILPHVKPVPPPS